MDYTQGDYAVNSYTVSYQGVAVVTTSKPETLQSTPSQMISALQTVHRVLWGER